MMEQLHFDNLTRTMAAPRSSGRAARFAGVALGAAVLAGKVLWPRSAAAEVCSERIPNPEYTPSSNGCGAEGGAKFPDHIWEANFKPGCDAHDICYGTCNIAQQSCDDNFGAQLLQACADAGLSGLALTGCEGIAGGYYIAVSEGGEAAYEAAQNDACICCETGGSTCGDPPTSCCASGETCCDGACCPAGQECCGGTCCPAGQQCCDGTCKATCDTPKSFCRCNGACYSTAVQCTAECQVSLGCFTDICRPAEAGDC